MCRAGRRWASRSRAAAIARCRGARRASRHACRRRRSRSCVYRAGCAEFVIAHSLLSDKCPLNALPLSPGNDSGGHCGYGVCQSTCAACFSSPALSQLPDSERGVLTPLGILAIVGYETGQQRQLLPVVLTDNLIPRRQFRLAAPSLSPGTALRLFTGLQAPKAIVRSHYSTARVRPANERAHTFCR